MTVVLHRLRAAAAVVKLVRQWTPIMMAPAVLLKNVRYGYGGWLRNRIGGIAAAAVAIAAAASSSC